MATTPEGLPYPVGTDKVVDGDNAIQALAETTGTTFMLPLNTVGQRSGRVAAMLSESFAVVFDSGGRCQINVSGVFASVIYAHAVSSTFPFVVSVTGINPASMEFFAQFPNGANVTGAATLRFIIIGNRK